MPTPRDYNYRFGEGRAVLARSLMPRRRSSLRSPSSIGPGGALALLILSVVVASSLGAAALPRSAPSPDASPLSSRSVAVLAPARGSLLPPTDGRARHPGVLPPFSPNLRSGGQPTTAINGSVHVNGSLAASTTYVDGDVNISGSAVTSNYTQTAGWADYGPTLVTGTMSITSLAGNSSNIYTSAPGSSLWVQPDPVNRSGLNLLQGNIAIGSAALGQTFDLTTNGVNITIDANQAGGFFGYPSGSATINVANFTSLRDYANSSSSISVYACVFGICFTNTVAPGALFLLASIDCVPLLGCLASVPTEYISWNAGAHFTILGATTTSGQGMTASLPDSRMDIYVPSGTGVNISMTPNQGRPVLSVGPGATYPAEVVTGGRVAVSGGEDVVGDVTVHGTFSAGDWARNGGTFLNIGGLTITGAINTAGEQLFSHKLQLGPEISIDTFPQASVVTNGPTTIDADATILGATVAQGSISILGNLTQNATLIHIGGTLSVNGTLTATGSVATVGTTSFSGQVSSSGDISMPHAFLNGTFRMDGGEFLGTGSTLLVGTSVGAGWTWVNATTYAVVGSAWLNGTVEVNGTISSNGASELLTAPGGALRLTATVLMGVGTGPTPWTSEVEGSVLVRGNSYANGTSTFNGTVVSFPNGLKVVGEVDAQGNISVEGTTAFTGAVTSSGVAAFPGMVLSGTFGLSSVGGMVNGTGSSSVAGNVTLAGTLTVDHGVFSEVGTSSIVGSLTMTGTVVVTGDSTLSTSGTTTLSLTGNIDLAGAAHIEGNVNTSGNVTISGSATLSLSEVTIEGSLQASGTVYSRGTIELTGTADFQGPLDTLGRTDLPGLSVAGNYTLAGGYFDLTGSIDLTGYTISHGTILANASGYFVTGSSRIVGHTVATGSVAVWGSSTTVGFVDLGDGATLGSYMVVHGGMSAGGLPLSGTIILPNDTVTFGQGANISGSVWQRGLLLSQGGVVSFSGESNVTGTVSSPGTPQLQGPLVINVLGGPMAITLGPEFFAFLAGLLLFLGIAGIELLRLGWKYRRPFTDAQRAAVRPLWPLALLSALLVASGGLLGTVRGYDLGAVLTSPANAAQSAGVATSYALAASLLLGGCAIWVLLRGLYARRRARAERPSGQEPTLDPPRGGPGGASLWAPAHDRAGPEGAGASSSPARDENDPASEDD